MTGQDVPPPPPPPDDASSPGGVGAADQPRRLVRPRDERMLAGVAAGLAAYLRVDATLVRIAFVVLVFVGGVGLLAYAAGWLLIPETDTAGRQVERERGPGFWVGAALLVLAGFAALGETGFLDRGVAWALLLIGVGVALWHADRSGSGVAASPDAAWPAAPSGAQATASAPPHATTTPTGAPAPTSETAPMTADTTSTAAADWTPPPVPEPSILGRLTLGLALIAAGVAATLERAEVLVLDAGQIAATALAVVGVGLVVGAFAGRARWLIAVGAILTPLVVIGSLASELPPLAHGIGERVEVATPDVEDPVRLGIGSLDLTVPDSARDRELTATVGIGELVLRVPDDMRVVVDGRVVVGEISAPDDRGAAGGPGVERRVVLPPLDGDPDAPTLTIDADVGVGQIDIRRDG